jgi:hypothetical protein
MLPLLPGEVEVFKEWGSSIMDLRSYDLKEGWVGHGIKESEELSK